jgi:hypothetical protein
MDFIKTDGRRDDFARAAPELLIVDEAHTCAFGYEGRGGRHQRHQLLKQLSAKEDRHLILVTATPHSGKEEAFRSLLTLLKPEFANLPGDLTGPEREPDRRRLASHFVQRRRGDIRRYMAADTPFPERETDEATYSLSPEYRRLFDRVLRYAREVVTDPAGGRHRQRVRWWSALALLRSLASSPAAAAATLRKRSEAADGETPEQTDEMGRRAVFDADVDEQAEAMDVPPGADTDGDAPESSARRRLLEIAREAERLEGDKDAKLLGAVTRVKALLKDGFRPILFCRFIPTADYLARELRDRLPKDVAVEAVTGELPASDREARVEELGKAAKRVLVATDCLSEGINLQDHFDAVVHYDLAWSPTRHEQREGRVDRFGQPRSKVSVLTYYGVDNRIDGIVLDILIRKHKTIRSSLGISVPVPIETDALVEAVFEGLLLREKADTGQEFLPGLEAYLKPKKDDLYGKWDAAAEREKRSRTMFAQESIKVDDVAREIEDARAAVGSAEDVARFTVEALRAHGAVVSQRDGLHRFNVAEVPRALRDALGEDGSLKARFSLPVEEEVTYLSRTHPFVEALATHVLDTSLDALGESVAQRGGVIRTRAVTKRTTLLLVRFRYDIVTRRAGAVHSELAEECRILAFAGAPENAEWLDEVSAIRILEAAPAGNIAAEQAAGFITKVVEGFDSLRAQIEAEAQRRAEALLEAHRRVRQATRVRGTTHEVHAKLPVDVIGIYVVLPLVS